MKIKAPSIQCCVANVLCLCKRKGKGIEGIKSFNDLITDKDHQREKETSNYIAHLLPQQNDLTSNFPLCSFHSFDSFIINFFRVRSSLKWKEVTRTRITKIKSEVVESGQCILVYIYFSSAYRTPSTFFVRSRFSRRTMLQLHYERMSNSMAAFYVCEYMMVFIWLTDAPTDTHIDKHSFGSWIYECELHTYIHTQAFRQERAYIQRLCG